MNKYRVYYVCNDRTADTDFSSLECAIDFMYCVGIMTKELVMLSFTGGSKRYYFDGNKFEIKQG